jgi:hypothetical protein
MQKIEFQTGGNHVEEEQLQQLGEGTCRKGYTEEWG